MVQLSHVRPPLTQEELLFLRAVADDTEEAPWMTMGDLQLWAATGLAWSLRIYGRRHGRGWYAASMLPIYYPRPGLSTQGFVSPDVMVAYVEDRERSSYQLEEEGVFPPFVLEVLSPDSVEHDLADKRRTYDLLGAQEYALFAPRPELRTPQLAGFRRDAAGVLAPWEADAQGRLWSEVLGLYLVAAGRYVQARRADGTPLLTPEEEAAAREEAEQRAMQAMAAYEQEVAAREQAERRAAQEAATRMEAEQRAAQEAAARVRAEEELAMLRAEMERHRATD